MATVRLSDVVIPEVYNTYTSVDSPEKTEFFQSGIVIRNAMLDAKANEGGETINLPFWNDLDASIEPNISSDDPAQNAVPNKVVAGKQVARSAYLNQWYSTADLAGEIAGSSPMKHIKNRFGTYWKRQWQRRLIAITNGILADNVANDGSDMVVDVAVEAIASQTPLTKFNSESFIDAIYTMGDAADGIGAVAVHSAIMSQMVKNDDIEYYPDSEGVLRIPTYKGVRVIVDDGLPVVAGTTDGFKYTSVLFGSGAFGYGEGTPETPVEVERQGLQGNGAGVEYIGERKTWLIHPAGFSSVGTPAAESFTNAELATAAVWDRIVDRKLIPMAFLITN